MANISDALKNASQILMESGVAEPRREASSLLRFALDKDRAFLIAHPEYELNEEENKRFVKYLTRRAGREPLQYITGRQEFYGLDFAVSPGVLIPRPETETLVENALDILEEFENPRFCEVGVGSGCISISILKNLETATAVGLEISDEALAAAKKNAENHEVSDRFRLKKSDVFSNLDGEEFDLIVSNPPYVPQTDLEGLQKEVRDFEPHTALFGGADGLEIIEKIITDAPRFLKTGGFLLLEIGFNQSEMVAAMFSEDVWGEILLVDDLQGIPRIVEARKIK